MAVLKMSSDEDFSIVVDNSLSEIDQIKNEIKKQQAQYKSTMQETQLLQDGKMTDIQFTKEFQHRSVGLRQRIDDTRQAQDRSVKKMQAELERLEQEQDVLKSKIQKVESDLGEMNETQKDLKQQTEVSTAVPERKVVFHGDVAEGAQSLNFDIKPHIVYPMEEGTAFITFEDEEVAEKVLSVKEHEVELGDCKITVQAEPVQFLVPSSVEMDTQVSPNRVLVSNLPAKEDMDRMMDKLEIFFSKSKNGGGEVVDVEKLDDGNVVITFVKTNISKALSDKHMHEIEMERGKKHKVKVTPFLNGDITSLKTSNTSCSKTVLLTGIPNVMDRDSLQDLLEIHFQKTSNGGGEVDAIIYNPVGERTLAVFEEDILKDENQ